MFIFAGVAMTYSGGGAISENMTFKGTMAPGKITGSFKAIGQTPWIILIMLAVVLVMHVFLNMTKYGRYLYAVGGNREAAKLVGINVGKYRLIAYLLSALFAGIAGLMLCSRVGSFQINAGEAYLMPAIAAAFIGESVGGAGKANAIGTFVGAVLIGILENGLIMLSVPYYALNIVKGIVLAAALALTFFRQQTID
jgi:simple sugar transport system permease protein